MSGLLVYLLTLASFVFIARALISWLRIGPDSAFAPVQQFLYRITEPVLAPVRRFMPRTGGIDLSALVVIIGINLILIPIAQRL